MSDKLRGKVCNILSSTQLVINLGENDKVTEGMLFAIGGNPTNITDPDSGEILGVFHPTKVKVRVAKVYERFSLCTMVPQVARIASEKVIGITIGALASQLEESEASDTKHPLIPDIPEGSQIPDIPEIPEIPNLPDFDFNNLFSGLFGTRSTIFKRTSRKGQNKNDK